MDGVGWWEVVEWLGCWLDDGGGFCWQLSDWATDWVVIAAGWMASCCVTGLLDMRWQVGYGRVP